MKDSALILSESRKMLSAEDTLRTSIEELTPSARVVAWQILDLLEKNAIKPRKEQLRKSLFDLADEIGVETDTGTKSFEMEGAKVSKISRKGKVTYDMEKLQNLLEEKEIVVEAVIQEVTSYKVNEDYLSSLIGKKLSMEELMEVVTVSDDTYALKVKKSKKVLGLLK